MSTAIAERPTVNLDAKVIEQVLLAGDLSKLNPEQRLHYYNSVCTSLGLNPLTQPFAYLNLSGKTVLYAKKDATDQLRKLHSVSIVEVTSQRLDDVFVVTAKAQDKSGRTDASTGAVPIANLKGEALANALMKGETKAKRRVTLSICGLGMLDETEVETIPSAQPVPVDAPRRVELPAGTVQILRAQAVRRSNVEWAEVTFVTAEGEEQTLLTEADPRGGAAALFEQLAQEAVPVVLTTKVTPRSKKTVIDQATRYQPPAPAIAESNAIDAEIAAQDAKQAGVPF